MLIGGGGRSIHYGFALVRHGAIGKDTGRSICAPCNDRSREEAECESLARIVVWILTVAEQSRQEVFEFGLVAVGNENAVEIRAHDLPEKVQNGSLESVMDKVVVCAGDGSLKDEEDAGEQRKEELVHRFK